MHWLSRLSKPFWINLIFWAFCVLLVVVIFTIGIVPQVAIGQDLFALLNTAERMHRGVRPYVDFDTLIGPLSFVPMLIGVGIVGVVPYVFVIASGITIPFIGFLTWYYFLSRKPTIINLIASIYICLTWSSPVVLHGPITSYTYGMYYDRWGFALLSLLTLFLLERIKGVSFIFGILVGILFFIKIPFGVSGAILTALYILRNRQQKEILLLSCGIALIFIVLTSFLGVDGVFGMTNYVIACGQKQAMFFILRIGQVMYDALLLLPLIPITYLFIRSNPPFVRTVFLDMILCILAGLLSDYCCTVTFANPDMPIIDVVSIFIMGQLIGNIKMTYRRISILTVCCGLLSYNYLRDISSFCFLLFLITTHTLPMDPSVDGYVNAQGFEHCVLYLNTARLSTKDLLYYDINDGLALIASHPELKNSRVACIDFTDWFSIARHVPSSDHMPIVIQYGFTINENHIPEPAFILQGCSAIIFPKNVPDSNLGVMDMVATYGPYMKEHFKKMDESDRWILVYN